MKGFELYLQPASRSGKTLKVLFICTANRDRSKTAEVVFSRLYNHIQFKSAGINRYLSERHGGTHLKKYMLDNADLIICMEHCHADYITRQIDKKYLSKIQIIELGDTETYLSEQLVKSLIEKCTPILEQYKEK